MGISAKLSGGANLLNCVLVRCNTYVENGIYSARLNTGADLLDLLQRKTSISSGGAGLFDRVGSQKKQIFTGFSLQDSVEGEYKLVFRTPQA
jgi:hypothetical protein